MEASKQYHTIAELYILAFIREQQAVQVRNLFHHWCMEKERKEAE